MSDEKELIIVRGSTPLLSVTLPEDISTSDIATGIISISQRNKGVLISKTLEEMTVDGNKYSVFLKQSETLKLDSTKPAAIQAKFCTIDDIVLVSFIQNIEILPVNNEKLFEQNNPSGDTYEATGESGIEIVPDLVDFTPDMDVEQVVIKTDDYTQLRNKPVLNGVTINGNQTSDEFGIYNSEQVDDLLEPIVEKETEQDERISTLERVSGEHGTAIGSIEEQIGNHTLARNVLADEYTNSQIDDMIEQAGQVKTVNNVQPDQNGNVQIAKADIGLGNVDNTADADKPISTAAQEALDQKVEKVPGMGLSQNSFTDTEKEKLGALPTGAELTAELSEKVDKEAGKGLSTEDFTSAEKTKLAGIEAGAQANTITGVKGDAEASYRTGNVNITKDNVGLGNVTNDAQVKRSEMGTVNGVAMLDSSGKVPAAQLPSFVDDVIEYPTATDFPETGETGKIYVALDTNKTYRWGGSAYVEISESLALGETSSTAYRGDRGKAAYDHSQKTSGNPHNVSKSDVGLGNVDNTSDADKPVSAATQAALDLKQNKLTFDTEPTEDSGNPVTSGGLYSLLEPVASEATGQSILETETAMNTTMETLLTRLVDAHLTTEAGDQIVQDLMQGNILLAQLANNIEESGVF